MYNNVFFIIITVLVLSFLFNRIISILEIRNMKTAIPDELSDVYDSEKYEKQQRYQQTNSKFALLSSSFSFLITLSMFVFGGFAWVDEWVRGFSDNDMVITLLFFGVIMLVSGIINIPFSLYDTFVIEEKFGFNKTKPMTFFMDLIKGWIVGGIIGGILLTVFIWFYQQTGTLFWLYMWLVATVFSIFMSMFYSNLIVPLFNKQTPLQEGKLRDAIESFAQKVGFKLNNIYTIDGSKRSTKANAYFTGLGPKKRIVLYDTLIEDLSEEEIVSVLAHEIGHYKHKHTSQGMIIGILQTGLTLYILSLFIASPALSAALGSETVSFHLGLIAFSILYSPLNMILGILMNMLSRKNEYQADHYARKHFDAEPLIRALKKLSCNNLSNLTPHPLKVFVQYSHPTLLQRIRAMKL
jgi:STE24 endopeptidase